MNNTELMYNEIMMDHYMMPHNKKVLENHSHHLKGVNPSCGDEIELYLEIENNIIKNASFTGHGCAVSLSSTSILIDSIIGKSVEEAKKIIIEFRNMILNKDNYNKDLLDEALAFENIKNMPARIKCADLAYKTLESMIN